MKIGVSSCLLGINCKYNGQSNYNEGIIKLKEKYELIPICPEVLGGLPTPRIPAEIIGDKVINQANIDVTSNYNEGAKKALQILKENDINAINYIFSHQIQYLVIIELLWKKNFKSIIQM